MMYLRWLNHIGMNLTCKIGLSIVCILTFAGCKQAVDHHGKTPLVSVGDDFLYKEDLMTALPAGLKGNDSLQFVDKYIKGWVEDALLFDKAEGNIPDNMRIDELVASYRRALITHAYQEELVRQKLSGEVTDEEIENYYSEHQDMFLLGQPMVKGLFLKVPLNTSQLSNVRTWYKNNTRDAIDNLEKFCVGGAVIYDYFFDRWTPVSELSAKIPNKSLETDIRYLDTNRNVETKDTAFCYFLHVEDFMAQGEKMPIEYAKSEIKNILINLKRVEFIKRIKEDLYRKASDRNDITYY